MTEATNLLKEYIQRLPEEVRIFVESDVWSEKLESILVQYDIDEEVKTSISNELFMVLVGIESFRNFEKNLREEVGLDADTAKKITSQIDIDIIEGNPNTYSLAMEQKERQSRVGSDFEQMILNQAKGMMPARAAETALGSMNHESSIMGKKVEAPRNLPSHSDENQQEVHNYGGRIDPYREPIE